MPKPKPPLYIYLKKGKFHRTIHIRDWIVCDVDSKYNILGVEILDWTKITVDGKKVKV